MSFMLIRHSRDISANLNSSFMILGDGKTSEESVIRGLKKVFNSFVIDLVHVTIIVQL